MKSILAAIFMLVLAQAASAQKVRISDPTNKCTISRTYGHPCINCVGAGSWSYSGTEQIDTHTYAKLNYTGFGTDVYIREDTLANLVYVKYGSYAEMLLYDYNWQIGDSVGQEAGNKPYVNEIDTIVINGFNHKVFRLAGSSSDVIIEGIGTLYSPFTLVNSNVALMATVVCFSNANGTPNVSNR